MTAHIIVGLGWGDEGKGITTDYLCSKFPSKAIDNNLGTVVVRYGGGQQCGHTVVHNGIKHINSNFGSGTLRGHATYFTEHCTVYLNTMQVEKEVLEDKGVVIPKMFIHPLAKITTPYDVALNRISHINRKHGSCGLGIGATMDRNLNSIYKLYAIDLQHPELFKEKLRHIEKYVRDLVYSISYLPDIDNILDIYNGIVRNEMEMFNDAIENHHFEIRGYDILNNANDLIFEGNQGILLDMDHGTIPNVTFAHTTSRNAIEVCNKLGIIPEIYYVTRCYQTRHGNGWMTNEDKIELINNEDEINFFNDYQLDFRIGEMDYGLLNHAINLDKIYSTNLKKNLVVTCLDQRPDFDIKLLFNSITEPMQFKLTSHSSDSKDFLSN